ncbi:MAG: thiol-disulfide oxidoreductase DCC family protein [Chloroflexaceae bacterium]
MTMPRYTLLYDGGCRICTGQIGWIEAYNDGGWIEVLDMRSPEARARFPHVTPEDAQREVHLVAPDGTLYRGADAVRETLLRLPGLRGLGELMRLPGAMLFARPVYACVAQNRYLLGGRTDTCDDGTCQR